MRRLLILSCLLASASPAPAGFDSAADNVAVVSDRAGNLITVSNRFDGQASYVQATSLNRYRNVNWDRSHSDGYMERMTSIFLDHDGNILLAGVRMWQGDNYMWMMKYSTNGQVLWERTDAATGCVAFNIVGNADGDTWVAGSCADGPNFNVRLLRYSANGALLWAQNYTEGGRSYVRNLNLDFVDRASLTLEIAGGRYGGKYARTIVFDTNGSRVTAF